LARQGLTQAKLQKTLVYINQITSSLADAQPNLPDADLLRREFSWAADMLRHACRRGMWVIRKGQNKEDTSLRQQLAEEADRLIAEYREIWLARNRVGGLKDSLARMEKMRRDYV
jgi:hexosaminidase